MHQNLENYLSEIGHYLAVKDGAQEILAEIRSHILEKTEGEFGTITDDTVAKTISKYGKPQHIAAKYLEGVEIISPIFKRYLFHYTAILFSFHVVLIVAACLLHRSMVAFPFLYIPAMNVWRATMYIPTTYFCDFGLVTMFLYFVTQRKKELRLPWPRLIAGRSFGMEVNKPKISSLAFLLLVFAVLLYALLRFGTFFFASLNSPAHPVPLFGPAASLYFSTLFLVILGCEIIGYAARFTSRSRWVDLMKNFMILILLQFVWNSPMKADFVELPGIDLKNATMIFVVIFSLAYVFKFLRSLIFISTKQLAAKR
jgi:hypothetical protein